MFYSPKGRIKVHSLINFFSHLKIKFSSSFGWIKEKEEDFVVSFLLIEKAEFSCLKNFKQFCCCCCSLFCWNILCWLLKEANCPSIWICINANAGCITVGGGWGVGGVGGTTIAVVTGEIDEVVAGRKRIFLCK